MLYLHLLWLLQVLDGIIVRAMFIYLWDLNSAQTHEHCNSLQICTINFKLFLSNATHQKSYLCNNNFKQSVMDNTPNMVSDYIVKRHQGNHTQCKIHIIDDWGEYVVGTGGI